jgi:hypothetical protein
MEVVFAVAIVATALAALQATVAGSIESAGTSVNRRAAREACRSKLEEVLLGIESPDGSGELEDRPGFRWTARSEEVQVGAADHQTETIKVVTVEMSFPTFGSGGGGGGKDSSGTSGSGSSGSSGGGSSASSASLMGDDGTETIRMSSVLPPDDSTKQQPQGSGQ